MTHVTALVCVWIHSVVSTVFEASGPGVAGSTLASAVREILPLLGDFLIDHSDSAFDLTLGVLIVIIRFVVPLKHLLVALFEVVVELLLGHIEVVSVDLGLSA